MTVSISFEATSAVEPIDRKAGRALVQSTSSNRARCSQSRPTPKRPYSERLAAPFGTDHSSRQSGASQGRRCLPRSSQSSGTPEIDRASRRSEIGLHVQSDSGGPEFEKDRIGRCDDAQGFAGAALRDVLADYQRAEVFIEGLEQLTPKGGSKPRVRERSSMPCSRSATHTFAPRSGSRRSTRPFHHLELGRGRGPELDLSPTPERHNLGQPRGVLYEEPGGIGGVLIRPIQVGADSPAALDDCTRAPTASTSHPASSP